MKNVLVLAGGIGNQLFQLSAAFHVFKDFQVYERALTNFAVQRSSVLGELLPSIETFSGNIMFNFWVRTKLPFKNLWPMYRYRVRYGMGFKYLAGYYQDVSYFNEGIGATLRILEEFNEQRLQSLSHKCSITKRDLAIHIRLGDYTLDDKFWLVDLNYIKRALMAYKNIHRVYVFSQEKMPADIEKEIISNCQEVVQVKDLFLSDTDEFLLMSCFSNLIISNSTFSFWSGMVQRNRIEKSVTAPAKYFRDRSSEEWLANCLNAGFKVV